MEKNLIYLTSKISELSNKLIISKLEKNGIKSIVPSHGDIFHLLYLKERVTMKEISDFVNKTKPTVTVLVEKLEKLDYILKEKCDKDSRITYITLTSKGKNLEPIFKKISEEINYEVYKNLSNDESLAVEETLKKIIKGLNS
ncbi:MAG: transcriptional regulator [Arcobacteraceae bacterium]|jgi:DNA-binding MarR family transcriptional regulator|nr:transcriptional regulator [Arcobacteraceae bacterium]